MKTAYGEAANEQKLKGSLCFRGKVQCVTQKPELLYLFSENMLPIVYLLLISPALNPKL